MLKKATLFALMLVMVICGTTSCGQKPKNNEQKVTLNWYTFVGEQSELKYANEAINKELKTLMPNTSLKMVQNSGFDSKWSIWMTSNEPVDIAWTGYMVSMQNEVTSGNYSPLDDLIKEYGPDIASEEEKFKTEYETGKYNGVTYCIPNIQPVINQSCYFEIPAELYKCFDTQAMINAAKSSKKFNKAMADVLEDYMTKAKASGLCDTNKIAKYFDLSTVFKYIVTRGYDFVTEVNNDCWLVYDAFNDNAQIKSFVTTDEYKLWAECIAKWVDMGFVSKEVVGGAGLSDSRTSPITAGRNEMLFNTADYNSNVKEIKANLTDVTQYRVLLDSYDNMYQGTLSFGNLGTYTCIPSTCRNKEKAIQLINLLKTKQGINLFNDIVYGVEGRHYSKEYCEKYNDYVVKGSDYSLQPDVNSSYGIPNWEIGNVYSCYRTPDIADGQREFCLDFIENVRPTLHKTRYYNFKPNIDDVLAEYHYCSSIIEEYNAYIYKGELGSDWQKKYDEMIEQLQKKGINVVSNKLMEQACEETQ